MKLSPNNHRRRKFTVVIGLLAIVIAAAVIFLLIRRPAPSEPLRDTPQAERPSAVLPSSEKQPDPSTPDDNAKQSPQRQYEGEPVRDRKELTGSFTYRQMIDGQLVLRLTIDQLLTDGRCVLTLSQGDQRIERTAPVIQNPSSSSCQGFSVPRSELAPGLWNISVAVKDRDRQGEIRSTVEVTQ